MTMTELDRLKAYAASLEPLPWNPVYADVINDSDEGGRLDGAVGCLVSAYPPYTDWDFYPVREIRMASSRDYALRREQKASGKRFRRIVVNKPLSKAVPKWVGEFRLANLRNLNEMG